MSSQAVKTIAVDKIVGLTDIAERLGVTVRSMWNAINRDRAATKKFPEPIANPGRRPVWDWDEVEKWSQEFSARRPKVSARK